MAGNGTNGRFTPTQTRLLSILADGMPHTPEELLTCLDDPLSELINLQLHISLLRKKLRPAGQDIILEYIRRDRQYRQVRLLNFRE